MTSRPRSIPPEAARDAIATVAERLGLPSIPPRTLDLLARHVSLLYEWNQRINLTAIRDPREGIRLHVLESLEALPTVDACLQERGEGETPLLADLGSGNGYPALPILFARPDLAGELWERTARKADFLAAVLRRTGTATRIRVRETSFAGRFPDPPAIVTLRAFPEPLATIRALAASPPTPEKGSARRPSILAWLAEDDAARLAGELAGRPDLRIEVTPLRTRPRAALLAVRPRPPAA